MSCARKAEHAKQEARSGAGAMKNRGKRVAAKRWAKAPDAENLFP